MKYFINKILRKKNTLLGAYILLALGVLFHLISYQHPFLYEDEALYLYFGLSRSVAPDCGIIWKILMYTNSFITNGSELKLMPLFLGFSSAVGFYFILKKGLNLNKLNSIIFTILYISSPIFYSQAHRIRPEIVHVFFAMISVMLYIFTIKDSHLNSLKSIFKNRYFIFGTLCLLFIPHSHIMGILHLPAIGVLLIWLFWDKTKSMKQVIIGISIIGVIFFVVFLMLLPGILQNSIHHYDSFKTNSFLETIIKSWNAFTISFKVWYWDLHDAQHIFIPKYFTGGRHLKTEGLTLYFMATISSMIVFYNAFASVVFRKKEIVLTHIISFASWLNCVVYVLAIVIFRRTNNSYNIILLPWMLIGISSIFSNISWKLKFENWLYNIYVILVKIGLSIVFFIAIVHNINFIFPLRKTNFNPLLAKLKNKLKKHKCESVSTASCPYFIFLQEGNSKKILPFGDIIATNFANLNGEGFTNKYFDKLLQENACLVVIARNYYGFDWWGQYPDSISHIRKILDKDFKIISKISMPFYKNDPFYPLIKENKWQEKYPIGADTIYIGGQETIWIMKKKKKT